MSDSSDVEQGTPARGIFFRALINMINAERHTGCIDWLPDRNGFVILQKRHFIDILPRYFAHCKYTSWTRRLKRWGFYRTSNNGAFYHDEFKRWMMSFDLEGSTNDNIPKVLPLKKRHKRHSVPSVSENSDVSFMPELMRSLNRQKRVAKQAVRRSLPMASVNSYQDRTSGSVAMLDKSVEAAQTLASLVYYSNSEDTRNLERLVQQKEEAYYARTRAEHVNQDFPRTANSIPMHVTERLPQYGTCTGLEDRVSGSRREVHQVESHKSGFWRYNSAESSLGGQGPQFHSDFSHSQQFEANMNPPYTKTRSRLDDTVTTISLPMQSIEHYPRYEAFTGLETRVSGSRHEGRHVEPRKYGSWRGNGAELSSLPYTKTSAYCQLTSDSRVPIHYPCQRRSPAFNRAA